MTPALAEDPPTTADVEITGHIVRPEKIDPAKSDISVLKVPTGFHLERFADGLINPRILAVGPDGTVYATRRSVGDVVMLKDTDGDGKADIVRTVASRPNMHGIAIDGRKAYLVTIKEIYVTNIASDGSFGPLTRIVDDLPDAGQHADRTIAVGADGMLYVSVGSTCNVCIEDNPENATMLQVKPDGSSRRIIASGLRNTIGFAFQPANRRDVWLGSRHRLAGRQRAARGDEPHQGGPQIRVAVYLRNGGEERSARSARKHHPRGLGAGER